MRVFFTLLAFVWREQFRQGTRLLFLSAAMIFNNALALASFALIFYFSPEIRGWTVAEYLNVYTVSILAFATVAMFGEGTFNIGESIATGGLDSFLCRPTSPLTPLCVRSPDLSAAGDFIMGFIIMAFTPGITSAKVGMLLALAVMAIGVYWGLCLLLESLAFWGNSTSMIRGLHTTIVILKTSPPHGMPGWLKALLLTIIPVGFINVLPPTIMREPWHWEYWLLMALASVTIVLLAIVVFYRGLRRYTSGNQIVMLR